MHTDVAERMAINAALVSRAVEMVDDNAVHVDITVFDIGSTTSVVFLLQLSNDLANWAFDTSGPFGFAASAGYTDFTIEQVAARYVRIVYAPTTAGTAIAAVGINTAHL